MSDRAGKSSHADSCRLASAEDARVTQRVVAATSDVALTLSAEGLIESVSTGESLKTAGRWTRLVGQHWNDTVTPECRGKVDRILAEARAGETPRGREINQQVEGGGQLPFLFSAVPIEKDGRVMALGRDLRTLAQLQQQMLGAQQAMERELARVRQAETRYRVLFQVTSEAVLIADAGSGKILEANPAAAVLLDEPVLALQGRTLKELFAASGWPAVQALIGAVEAGGRPADIQVELTPNGGVSPARGVMVSVAVFRQSGAVLLLVRIRPAGGAQPTEGARASRLLAALNSLPDGFVVVGEDLRILCANPAFCEMVQQAAESLILGEPIERWVGRPGIDLDIVLANLREHGAVRNFATIVRSPYDAPQEAVLSAVAVKDTRVPCIGLSIRTVPARRVGMSEGLSVPALSGSAERLQELVGRVPLKEIVRESADLIERLCIEAALKVSGDNRASAAQLLGLSRQGLYLKMRRYDLGGLDPGDSA